MNTDKDLFSEALDPENGDNWVKILKAKSRPNRENIYRVTVPGMSVQILKARALSDEDDIWGYVELAPTTSELPIFRIPIRYVEQYCPAPTLPTEALSDIYNVETTNYDGDGTLTFTRMVLHPNGYWLGVDPDDGEAHYIHHEDILEFSLTPDKT